MIFLRIIFGTLIALCGSGLMLAGAYLLISQFAWPAILIFVFFFAYGLAVINFGLAVAKGAGIRDALRYLLFLGNSSSLK